MRRILLVTNVFPPAIGGPATFMDALASELTRRGFGVTVLCSSVGKRDAGDASRPFRVRRVDFANRYRYEIVIRLALLRELARHRVAFVNTLEDYFVEANRIFRRRYLLKVVGDAVWERARNLGTTSLDIDQFQRSGRNDPALAALVRRQAAALRGAARVVVPSNYLRGLVAGWGVEPRRIDVVPNAVEDGFATAGDARAQRGGELRALFVGRITNWKGVDTLLLALARTPGVQLTIVGEGPHRPACHDLAVQLGVSDRVTWAGPRSRDEVRQLMVESDVLVLPSLYEGMSHTALEAAAVGLPVVASDRGGNPEVVTHERDGLLMPALDPEALSAALLRLRDGAALRERLGAGARRRSADWTFAAAVNRYAELLNEIA